MYLLHKPSGDLVEVLSLDRLFDPFQREITGSFHAGEELQEPVDYAKSDLTFPSGEFLPRCWVDPTYKAKLRSAGG
jgi:hypothetical protein